MRALGGVATVVLVASARAGCPEKKNADASADASANADAGAEASAKTSEVEVDARTIAVNGCLSCHSEGMFAQQRLTQAQWQKTVTKMVGWGANVEPREVAPLVAYLSSTYGPDAGDYTPETITGDEAAAEIAPTPDDPLPTGDAERGKPLFIDKCSGCHGADARGHIGVLLIDRPVLYRAADFTKMVRKGRGKMLPLVMSDAEIGDVLAHLRKLRNAVP